MSRTPYPQGTPPDPRNDPAPELPAALQNALDLATPFGAIVVPPNAFGVVTGGPAIANYPSGRKSAWLLDATTTERIDAPIWLPAGWTEVDVTVVWCNAGAGSGNVALAATMGAMAPTANLADFPNAAGGDTLLVTATASTAGRAVHTTISLDGLTDDTITTLWVERQGAQAADTLANDIAVQAVYLSRPTP